MLASEIEDGAKYQAIRSRRILQAVVVDGTPLMEIVFDSYRGLDGRNSLGLVFVWTDYCFPIVKIESNVT